MDENKLEEKIKKEIAENNSPISFKRFMHLALYDPEYGFYTTRVNLWGGENGKDYDFKTYPDLHSPKFGASFGGLISRLAIGLPKETVQIVEFGAGNGTLARDLLDNLKEFSPDLYERTTYRIIEISPRLVERQKKMLTLHDNIIISEGTALNAGLNQFNGFVINNELPDAFPVDFAFAVEKRSIFRKKEKYLLYVGEDNGKLIPVYRQIQDEKILSYENVRSFW